MHQVVSRQCAGNWSVSLSSCCAHSKHKKAQGEVGLLHWGTYVVVCRDLPAPLLGWQLQPAREGKASAAALLRPFLVEGVFPFFFCFFASVGNALSVCLHLTAPQCCCLPACSASGHQVFGFVRAEFHDLVHAEQDEGQKPEAPAHGRCDPAVVIHA